MNLLNIKSRIRKIIAYIKWKSKLLKTASISVDGAQNILFNYYFKEKPNFRQNNVVKPEVDLHIIVPVYNVKSYLTECIDSILNQKTEFSYHVTFVNDGSTDDSMDILNQYCEKSMVTVISKTNGGVSSARNVALQHICGKYVMFVDSDDILTENAIQVLIEIALDTNSDIVEGSHQLFNSRGKGQYFRHETENKADTNRKLFGFPWGKVIRSDLLTDFCFPENFLFEDTVMATLLYPICKNVYTTSEIVYFYRENENGISKTCGLSSGCIDTFWIMKYCLEERIYRGQVLDVIDLEKYLYALYRNYGRTCTIIYNVQESIFVLSCDLIERYFSRQMKDYNGKYTKLLKTVRLRSFVAFETLVNNWWLMK